MSALKAGDIVKIKSIDDNIKVNKDVVVQVGDTAKVVAVTQTTHSALLENIKWGHSLWFDYKDLELVSNGIRVLEPSEVFKAILGGKVLEFYDSLDDSWKPVNYHKDLSVSFIITNKFRLAKSLEDKRKEVISKLLADNVAVLCKCWDDDDIGDERLATTQAVTGVQVGNYPYITDNDTYGYGYAIDNNGNEIVSV